MEDERHARMRSACAPFEPGFPQHRILVQGVHVLLFLLIHHPGCRPRSPPHGLLLLPLFDSQFLGRGSKCLRVSSQRRNARARSLCIFLWLTSLVSFLAGFGADAAALAAASFSRSSSDCAEGGGGGDAMSARMPPAATAAHAAQWSWERTLQAGHVNIPVVGDIFVLVLVSEWIVVSCWRRRRFSAAEVVLLVL